MALAKILEKSIPNGITAGLAIGQEDTSHLSLDEDAFIEGIKLGVRDWLPNLAKSYGRESTEALLAMLGREFGNVVTNDILEELGFERLIAVVQHARINFEEFELANKLKKKKKAVDRVWCKNAQVGGAFKDELRLVLNPGANEQELGLISNSGKTTGTLRLDIGTVRPGEATQVKVWKNSCLVGTVTLRVQIGNENGPFALELVKARLNHALVKHLEKVFDKSPRVLEALHNYQPDPSPRDAGLVIKETATKGCDQMSASVTSTDEGATVVLHQGKEHIFENTLKKMNFALSLGPELCNEITIEKRLEGILREQSSGSGRSVVSLGENVLGSISLPAEISAKRKFSLETEEAAGKNNNGQLFKPSFKKKPVVLCSNTFDSTDVPLLDGLKIVFQGSQWNIEWIVFHDVSSGDQQLLQEAMARHLLRTQLADMSLQERMTWNGSWSQDLEQILKACWLQDVSQDLAMIEVHKHQHFNQEVLAKAVAGLREQGRSFEKVAGLPDLLHYLAKSLFLIPIPVESTPDAKQIRAVSGILEIVRQESERVFRAEFVDTYRGLISQRYSSLSGNTTLDVKRVLNKNILPLLQCMRKEVGGQVGSDLAQVIVVEVLAVALPTLKLRFSQPEGTYRLALKRKGFHIDGLDIPGIDGIMTFNLYTSFRLMLNFLPESLRSSHAETFYATFKPCIPSWIDCIDAKARQQVEKVLELEQERNSWAQLDEEEDNIDGGKIRK